MIYASFLNALRCSDKSMRLGYASYVYINCETQSEVSILVGKLLLKDKEKTRKDNIKMDYVEVLWY
jgi:hypothetical protein